MRDRSRGAQRQGGFIINPFALVGGGGGGTGEDPYFAHVVSLLNFGGADGSTSFTDAKGKVWTAYGDAQIDTSLGYNTVLFDGTGDYIQTPDHADFEFGAGDFCIEGISRVASKDSNYALFEKRGSGFSTGDIIVFVVSGETQVYSYDVDAGANVILAANQIYITAGVDFHWAWTRSGTTMRLFVNGVLRATKTTSATIADSSNPVTIGRDEVGGGRFYLIGRYRAFRVTKGVPRYTANFTPPSAPFPTS